ncbi:hypothetical protein XPA_010720 [Xanthoria parietina]
MEARHKGFPPPGTTVPFLHFPVFESQQVLSSSAGTAILDLAVGGSHTIPSFTKQHAGDTYVQLHVHSITPSAIVAFGLVRISRVGTSSVVLPFVVFVSKHRPWEQRVANGLLSLIACAELGTFWQVRNEFVRSTGFTRVRPHLHWWPLQSSQCRQRPPHCWAEDDMGAEVPGADVPGAAGTWPELLLPWPGSPTPAPHLESSPVFGLFLCGSSSSVLWQTTLPSASTSQAYLRSRNFLNWDSG